MKKRFLYALGLLLAVMTLTACSAAATSTEVPALTATSTEPTPALTLQPTASPAVTVDPTEILPLATSLVGFEFNDGGITVHADSGKTFFTYHLDFCNNPEGNLGENVRHYKQDMIQIHFANGAYQMYLDGRVEDNFDQDTPYDTNGAKDYLTTFSDISASFAVQGLYCGTQQGIYLATIH